MREICATKLPAIALGCMNLSHAYGNPPSREVAAGVVEKALDLGVIHFDTAALYGFGANESLLGPLLKPHRKHIFLASKGGLKGVDGKRVIDGRPESLSGDIEASLGRLQTDFIDLYYLHRWDKSVPIEDSVGALSRAVEAGKIRSIGLSEVSAETFRKAHAVHPVAVVQSEYSLWTRNPEIAVLDSCGQAGAAFVAFSPLARGFLTDLDVDPQTFADKDIRRGMPRFQEPAFSQNMSLLHGFRKLAREAGCTAAQLALAWVLHQGDHIHVTPGTTSCAHLEENFNALDVHLSAAQLDALDELINPATVSGPRYNETTQREIDTEEH